MKRFTNSLVFQIGVVIITAEIVVLSVSGFILLRQFNAQIDSRIEQQVQLPAKLMNAGQLSFDAVADQQVMQELVGEELLEGMIVGTNQVVFFSLDADYVGQNVRDLPDFPANLLLVTNPQPLLIREANSVISVAPIFSGDGRTPRFFIYVKAGTAAAQAAREDLIRLLLFSTAVTVLATSLIIILSFQFLIFRRLAFVLQVLARVAAGDLTARTEEDQRQDEIGFLQRRVNGMVAELEEKVGTLQESEDRYRRLVENAPYGVIIHVQDRIVYLNGTATILIGSSQPDQIIGTYIWDLIVPEYHTEVHQRLYQLRETSAQLPSWELKLRRLEGSTFDAEVVGIPFIYQGETAVQTVFRDISDRKKTEAQLQTYTTQLEQRNRELQDFAYISSHDLQEPLRKIQTFADRLQVKYAPLLDERGQDYLQRMQRAANRMQTLILDLLSFSRLTTHSQPFVSVNLGQIAQDVLADLDIVLLETGGQVEVKELPTIEADATQMHQLFQNLIINALKFHRQGVPPQVRIWADGGSNASDICQISVSDNGIGFEEKYGERIFEMFQRLHGRTEYEGTGIGLAICRRIVERHQGQIMAQSTPEQGATFIITLPLKQQKEEDHLDNGRVLI